MEITPRFNVENAVTMKDVFNSADYLKEGHSNVNYTFERRGTTYIPRLDLSIFDKSYLLFYLLDFYGDSERAFNDDRWFEERTAQFEKRIGGLWGKRILAQFNFDWTNCKTNEAYLTYLKKLRKCANDFWKDNYIEFYVNNKDFEGRNKRIDSLVVVYAGEWIDYIWRILDVDEIGHFLDDYNPVYKKEEERVTKKCLNAYPARRSYPSYCNPVTELRTNQEMIQLIEEGVMKQKQRDDME